MKDSVQEVINLLKGLFRQGQFRTFYDEDPYAIPVANLPAIVVEKLNDDTGFGMTGHDRVEERLRVKVILNQQDDWTPDNGATELTKRKIKNLVEARDPETKDYAPNTIKGVLRRNLQLPGMKLSSDMRFELGTVPRPEDVITAEGHVYLTVKYDVPVARNRS